jgi:hypothetical protein
MLAVTSRCLFSDKYNKYNYGVGRTNPETVSFVTWAKIFVILWKQTIKMLLTCSILHKIYTIKEYTDRERIICIWTQHSAMWQDSWSSRLHNYQSHTDKRLFLTQGLKIKIARLHDSACLYMQLMYSTVCSASVYSWLYRLEAEVILL